MSIVTIILIYICSDYGMEDKQKGWNTHMDVRLLKLSNNKGEKDALTSQDILSIHLGYYLMKGKVTYSTDISIANQPDYVILILGNSPVCYWCHVEKHDYQDGKMFNPQNKDFELYSPDKYKGDSNVSWLLIDSMKEIPRDFLDSVENNMEVKEFIGNRANHKIL